MKNSLFFLLLSSASLLGSCQQSTSATEKSAAPSAEPARAVNDAQAARNAVARFLKDQPESRLYILDSANVVDVDVYYQVLVPRTDWTGQIPDRARFQVDKATGIVQDLPVK